MTSKNLFFKRLKQDLEQRIWLPVVFFIIGFLMMEVPLFSAIERWQNKINPVERMREFVISSFFSPISATTVLTIGMAVIAGMSGFLYMHSAKKLDVYHSIPVRRESLFVQQYIYGVFYYLIPILSHVLICLVVCTTQGILNGQVLGQAIGFLLVQLLIYLAHYSVVVTVVCLTGNLVISILGSGILLTYSLILSLLKGGLMDEFFTTYYLPNDWDDIWNFSPVHLCMNLASVWGESEVNNYVYSGYWKYYIFLLLMAAAYTAFALFLYKKRPTEAANSSIAFPLAEPVIKTMVVLPVSLLAGFFFRAISYSYGFGWFIFGCIFGFVLCCPLMEIIFRKDVKAVFKHPLQLVINGVLVAVVLVIFRWDVFGYDSYVPAESKVESYAISFNGHSGIYPAYGHPLQYCMDHMEVRDNESARKLIEYGAANTRDIYEQEYDALWEGEWYCSSMVVRYTLTNGKEIYRNYLFNLKDEQVQEWLAGTYEDIQFKQGVYPVLNEENDTVYKGVSVKGTYSNDEVALPEEKMQKLVEVYSAELQNLTFDMIIEEYPVAEMHLAVMDDWEDAREYVGVTIEKIDTETDVLDRCVWESGYPIYPSFTETMALLKEYGLDWGEELPVENVISIYIEDSSREAEDNDGYYDKISTAEYTLEEGHSEQIASILAAIRSGGLTREFDFESEDYPYISVEISYSYGEQWYEHQYFTFKKGMMPEFILQDLKPLDE